MDSPLISVIIPTRNRQSYAEKTVRQIASMKQDIEVIVHDNSDDDSLSKTLKDMIRSSEVKYRYEKNELSFSENYNRAAELATGEYLCAIGDDDGILPNISDCAKWMRDKEIDAVKPAKDQVYFYPGNVNRKKNACLGYGCYSGSYYFTNPESSVISLLNDGGCNYLEKNLAGSYHGLVSMEAMKKVKHITGQYYGGLTPDMYSVICLSLLPNIRFAVVDYPISLPGVCPSSGSAASDSGRHVGRLEEAPHLKALPNYKWSKYIPRFYSVETIWAETMVFAICKMGREDLIDRYFNQFKLATNMYLQNKAHRLDIIDALPKDIADYVTDSCRIYKNEKEPFGNAIERIAIKISGKRKAIRNVKEISEATFKLSEALRTNAPCAPWTTTQS